MKRWIVIVVTSSLGAVGFTTYIGTHKELHAVTPAEYAAWETAVCDAAHNGLPNPGPLYVGDGKWAFMSCDVAGA
jgi:hypothetical protein